MVRAYKPAPRNRCGGRCGSRADEEFHMRVMRLWSREGLGVDEIAEQLGKQRPVILNIISRHSGDEP